MLCTLLLAYMSLIFCLRCAAAAPCRYLVLDTKQRSLSLSQEGMALLFALLAEQPGVTFRWVAGVFKGLHKTDNVKLKNETPYTFV
jgi:hypothetical protein